MIAYPTEGVYGLGCLPDAADAVSRIIELKQRDPSLGLILIASGTDQVSRWARIPEGADLRSSLERPVTWLVPAAPSTPFLLRGKHENIAVRITAHRIAAALCDAAGSALVSTSANVAGRPPARTGFVLRRRFGALVDYIVPGPCGPAGGASEIRELQSGKVIRAAAG